VLDGGDLFSTPDSLKREAKESILLDSSPFIEMKQSSAASLRQSIGQFIHREMDGRRQTKPAAAAEKRPSMTEKQVTNRLVKNESIPKPFYC
jgi:hypothetical protein